VKRVVVGVEDRPIELNGTRAVEDPAKNDASRSALEKVKAVMVQRITLKTASYTCGIDSNKKWLESLLCRRWIWGCRLQICSDCGRSEMMGGFTTRVSRLIDPVKNGRTKDSSSYSDQWREIRSTQRTDAALHHPSHIFDFLISFSHRTHCLHPITTMVTTTGRCSWQVQRAFLSLLLCSGLHLGDGFCTPLTSNRWGHTGLIRLHPTRTGTSTATTTILWAGKQKSSGKNDKKTASSKYAKTKKVGKTEKTDKQKGRKASNPMAQSQSSDGGSGAPRKKSAPPWQVLSQNDAKKNVVNELRRRDAIKEGTAEEQEYLDDDIYEEPQVLSKAFLSDTDKRLLNWKRFSPDKVPTGTRFVGAYLDRNLPPRLGVPEVAFLGRSNVGKSSLLNRLSFSARSSASDQARVGKTPGATASVNLYALHDAKQKEIMGWVDLPGFGYAKLSKETKESVQKAAEHYLDKRKELMLGILLVDIRRVPSNDDRAVLAALFDQGVPIVVVATKVDKVSPLEREQALEIIRDGLGLPDGQPLSVSSTTGEGTRDLWKIIMEACEAGIEEFKQKYDIDAAREKAEDDYEDMMLGDGNSDSEPFEDSEDIVYSQGFDWIHDSGVKYEGDDNEAEEEDTDWEDDEEDSAAEANKKQQMQATREAKKLESIVYLRRKAREMEKNGEV
jgi:GTP-binding protein